MVSSHEERTLAKIFLYASFASLILHAGVFLLVIQLSKAWGWIPVNESFFEVSIISIMDQPAPPGPSAPSTGLKADAPPQKAARQKKKPVVSQPAVMPDKAMESGARDAPVNHLPGDAKDASADMAMISDELIPSPGGGSGTGGDSSGVVDTSESSAAGGSGGFGSKMSYLDMVRIKIEKQKKYPESAQQRNIEGQVTVEFSISLDGRITDPCVSKSSGHPLLDLAAMDAVKKASPFSSPPREFFTEAIHINLPIRFELIR
jgi:TonB family protein